MIRCVARDEGQRRRRSSVVAAAAIVGGLLIGALTCSGFTGSGHAHASADVSMSTAHVRPADHVGHDGGSDVVVPHHASMACLIDITLRVADLEVMLVSEPNAEPETISVPLIFSGPEPPVPRTHS